MLFIIADDFPIFRDGLKMLLNKAYPDSHILEFDDGLTVENAILENHPNFCILDVDMPQKSGFDVLKSVREKTFSKIIILTMHKEGRFLKLALDMGADAYLVKDDAVNELTNCIEALRMGKIYVSKSLQNSSEIFHEMKQFKYTSDKLTSLTNTEFKTLYLVAQKYSSKEIANLLFITEKSVDNYRSRACKKLKIDTTKSNLSIWAVEHKDIIEDFKERIQ